MLASEVIRQMNDADAAYPFGFPRFNVFFPVEGRLSVYRSQQYWAVGIETLVFNPGPARHNCIETLLYCYGNFLPGSPGLSEKSEEPLKVTSDGPCGPLFDPSDVLGHKVRDGATDMRIRSEVVPITTNRKAYESAGVLIKWPKPPGWVKRKTGWEEPRGIHGCELLRLIAPKYRKLFYATDSEMIPRTGKRMALLLRLDEWYHADESNDERPSDSESYQMIAEAIAKNDPSVYRPTVAPNTHWRNWPQAGFL